MQREYLTSLFGKYWKPTYIWTPEKVSFIIIKGASLLTVVIDTSQMRILCADMSLVAVSMAASLALSRLRP